MTRLSVRARLLLALTLLALATAVVGAVSWVALTRGAERLDQLHDDTLAGVDRALVLSRQASDLAAQAPYLMTLGSPFRIAQEGDAAAALARAIGAGLPVTGAGRQAMDDAQQGIADLVRETTLRAGLRDRALRVNADLARSARTFAALSARPAASLAERQDWLVLQRLATALLDAGRAENLIGVGEFQREFTRLRSRIAAQGLNWGAAELPGLLALAEGPEGLFELRRQELSRQIAAEAALVRIRDGVAAATAHSAAVTAEAQAAIAGERARTTDQLALARAAILAAGLASAAVALFAAVYVAGYVTANLRAISDAMMRLAAGDRQSRLPRGAGAGDEIGKLLHAFRVFRANALRLDRSNRQMAQRTALFENMMAGISDGVAILTDQGTLTAHNPRLAAVLRVEGGVLAGRPRLADVVAAAGWQANPGPGGFADLAAPDGAHAEWRESALPGGGSVVLVSDATERRQLDSRLRQIQRIEALGKVSGEVAHDFGNILSTISGSLHLMETAPPARQPALRQTVASAVDLGLSLTGRLLSFARRQHLDPETVDLNALVEGMADLVGFALRDGIVLEVRPAALPLQVRVDPGQLESAILNLCLNAGQAIDGAGRIAVTVGAEPGQAVVTVADTGAGMPPEVLAHAMEPFFTARRDGTGTGLGLAMVYGFIRQSGGDIQITSAPGAGTTVRLTLPLQGGGPDPALPPLGRVVLVEDDPADMARAVALVAGAAVTLDRFAMADPALDRIAAAPLDLMITDLSLGGAAEGWELAEAALRHWTEARVVVVSGRLPPGPPLQGRFGARLVSLPKPLTAQALAAALAG